MDLMTPGYREWAPPPALAPLVECLWARVCGGDDEVRVMPDGASDVIWRRGHGTVHARDIDRAFDLDGELPPGTLARVRRFRRFLSLLDAGRDDLAGLAFDAGYADQAHLTRESRRLAGLSPARVIQSRRAA